MVKRLKKIGGGFMAMLILGFLLFQGLVYASGNNNNNASGTTLTVPKAAPEPGSWKQSKNE